MISEPERLFTQAEVNRIFSHVPRSTLRTWGLQELHPWAMERNDERGRGRYYKRDNIYQLGIVENISKLDIATDLIRKIISDVGDPPSMDKIIFITKGSEISPLVFQNLNDEFSNWDKNSGKKMIQYLEGLASRRDFERLRFDLGFTNKKHRCDESTRRNKLSDLGFTNKKHHKAFFDWSYAIVSPEKMKLLMLLPLNILIPITIIIDLRAIKKFIDINIE